MKALDELYSGHALTYGILSDEREIIILCVVLDIFKTVATATCCCFCCIDTHSVYICNSERKGKKNAQSVNESNYIAMDFGLWLIPKKNFFLA